MVEVKMAKMCGCAKRAKIEEVQTFETMDIALESANNLADKMNKTFCQKHNFQVTEENSNLVIQIASNR